MADQKEYYQLNGPQFIGIGAQRAGSTWFNSLLQQHPQIWIPPLKELHYFDKVSMTHYTSKGRMERFTMQLFRDLRRGRLSHLHWYKKYFFGDMSDKWYESLFEEGLTNDKLCFEFTPAYAILSDDMIKHIAHILPQLKILYILRSPIDRSWSHIVRRMSRKTGIPLSSIAVEDMIETLKTVPTIDNKSLHSQNIDRWSAHFDSKKIKIIFFEDLIEQTDQVLNEVFEFLNIDEFHDFKITELGRNRAAGGREMPIQLKKELTRRYMDEIYELSNRYGSHATKWLKECKRIYPKN